MGQTASDLIVASEHKEALARFLAILRTGRSVPERLAGLERAGVLHYKHCQHRTWVGTKATLVSELATLTELDPQFQTHLLHDGRSSQLAVAGDRRGRYTLVALEQLNPHRFFPSDERLYTLDLFQGQMTPWLFERHPRTIEANVSALENGRQSQSEGGQG